MGETALYFYRNRDRFSDWQAVVIYPSRRVEQSITHPYRAWLSSDQMHRIYLDELGAAQDLPLGIALMVLTILDEQDAPSVASELLARSQQQEVRATDSPEVAAAKQRVIIEMISTIMIYKFTHLSRQEVEAMLDLRLEETRIYREAREEGEQIGRQQGRLEGEQVGRQQGRLEGEVGLILRQLSRRLRRDMPDEVRNSLAQFGVEPLEELAEALLDFTTIEDLDTWLHSYPQQQQTRIERIEPLFTRQLGQVIDEELQSRLERLSIQQLDELENDLLTFSSVADLETWFHAHGL